MNLRKMRLAKKYSQVKIAQQLNVSQQSVAKWEAGGSLPRAELLPKIAKLFGCTVDELLKDDGEGEENENPEK